MLTRILSLAELHRWGREAHTLEARLPIKQLSRLAETLADTQGELRVQFRFTLLEAQRLAVRGRIEGTLQLTCQRCLQPMAWPVALEFAQAVVTAGDSTEQLPAGYEPWLPAPEGVALWELPEDELLLAVPDYPKHPPEQCKTPKMAPNFTGGANNPFAKLRDKL